MISFYFWSTRGFSNYIPGYCNKVLYKVVLNIRSTKNPCTFENVGNSQLTKKFFFQNSPVRDGLQKLHVILNSRLPYILKSHKFSITLVVNCISFRHHFPIKKLDLKLVRFPLIYQILTRQGSLNFFGNFV